MVEISQKFVAFSEYSMNFKSTFDTIDCTDSIKPSWQTLTLAQREGKRTEYRFTEKGLFLTFFVHFFITFISIQ